MERRTIITIVILLILVCTAVYSIKSNKSNENNEKNVQAYATIYIYNLTDKSTRTFTEPYSVQCISWSPDSEYFTYPNYSLKGCGDKIRQAEDLKVIENPIEKSKYSDDSFLSYWNNGSNLVVQIEGHGDFCFKPGSKILHPASEADKEVDTVSKLTEDEINGIKNKSGITGNQNLFSNSQKTRFFYFASPFEAVFYNMKTCERETTLQTIPYPKWSQKGDKIIYSIPKAGFASIKIDTTVNDAKLFDIYIYDFSTKEKTKIADFYAISYCSPNDKYIILVPEQFQYLHNM